MVQVSVDGRKIRSGASCLYLVNSFHIESVFLLLLFCSYSCQIINMYVCFCFVFLYRELCCHEQLETLRLMFAPSLFSPIHLLQVLNTHKCVTLYTCSGPSIRTLMPHLNALMSSYNTKSLQKKCYYSESYKHSFNAKHFTKSQFVYSICIYNIKTRCTIHILSYFGTSLLKVVYKNHSNKRLEVKQ